MKAELPDLYKVAEQEMFERLNVGQMAIKMSCAIFVISAQFPLHRVLGLHMSSCLSNLSTIYLQFPLGFTLPQTDALGLICSLCCNFLSLCPVSCVHRPHFARFLRTLIHSTASQVFPRFRSCQVKNKM